MTITLVGCGGGSTPAGDGGLEGGTDGEVGDGAIPDAPAVDDVPMDTSGDGGSGRCGNAMMEGTEECDDGNRDPDDGCSPDCMLECGDGRVSGAELCDTAIAAGEMGACPTDCDDADACTTDTLSGSGCSAECVHGDITTPAEGDGCCPSGATPATDSDCGLLCGDGMVTGTETCDTAIAAGDPGACPTACDDMVACTTDELVDGGTCNATCGFTAITMPADGDGCCPAGATIADDSDCTATCGDGVVSGGETCDTAITMGRGRCPRRCNDMMACTADRLVGGGTCSAVCEYTPITMPADGDGCCPAGATIGTDSDCPAVCGDRVVTPPEECDDGNTMSGDGCDSMCRIEMARPPTAFRMTDLDLRDPHTYVRALGCRDVTDTAFFGFSTNGELQDAIQMDGDGDGDLDLSVAVVFRPLDQSAMTNMMSVTFPDCTAPMSSTMCTLAAMGTRVDGTATNMASGTCLSPIMGTVRPYSPAVTSPTGPCFVSNEVSLVVTIAGIPVMLRQAQVAATYVGSPATRLVNGLVRGFLSEADADTTILPDTLPLVGGSPLSSLLPGGTGNCASHDDRDRLADGTRGWWFYLNFPATAVPYTEL